jgi:UDP-3-O-[3-hydroxymyristoyl] N-acetylglucosamine deacetylase
VSPSVLLEGVGLHSGAPCRVTLRSEPGPVALRSAGVLAPLADLVVASTARATTVESRTGSLRVATVEHAFAALAGLGVHDGVVLDVDGPELPLLDGGSSAWCAAIRRLDPRAGHPRLRVARSAVLEVGPSRFDFTPGDTIDVSVYLQLDDAPHVVPDARWRGDADDFVTRIAPARTFVLAREVEELVRRGLARHVDPECVVVVTSDALLHAGRPAAADEPARHKLLDLLGDLYLHGGPPIGRVHAVRPGHASNARAMRRALDEGVLVDAP